MQELCIQVYWTLRFVNMNNCSTPRSLLSFGGQRRRPWIRAVCDASNETYATNTNILICFLFDLRIIEELCKSSLMVQEIRSFVFFFIFHGSLNLTSPDFWVQEIKSGRFSVWSSGLAQIILLGLHTTMHHQWWWNDKKEIRVYIWKLCYFIFI